MIIGYAWEAEIICPDCAGHIDGNIDAHYDDPDCPADSAGNPIAPLFEGGDIPEAGIYCGQCNEVIAPPPPIDWQVEIYGDGIDKHIATIDIGTCNIDDVIWYSHEAIEELLCDGAVQVDPDSNEVFSIHFRKARKD